LLERQRADQGKFAAAPLPGPEPLRLTEWLYGCLLPSGGFARFADDPRVSAYHTFLGALCFQMLGVEMPDVEDAVLAVQALRRPDGGYAESAGQSVSQTNATAAAIGFLTMHDGLPAAHRAPAARFLRQLQSADGGLKPHAAVLGGDLLSTFTGLWTLWGLNAIAGFRENGDSPDLPGLAFGLDAQTAAVPDVAALARFLRGAAHPDGGFLACDADQTPDVEYTYYGVGTLALLRLWDRAE
jgi:geranylgeranyl transferase type-2 subunit beta